MGCNDWDRFVSGIIGKLAGKARLSLAAHLGDERLISSPRCLADVSPC